MTKTIKCIVAIALSFSFLFSVFGYSAITGRLMLIGTAKNDIPEGLFITDIAQSATATRLDVNQYSFTKHSTTVKTSLSKTSSSQTGVVTYRITVLNNTKLDYAYRGLYYQSDLEDYDNGYVSTSNSNSKIGVVVSFPNGRVVPAGGTLSFDVTYTIGRSLSRSTTFNLMLNYQFGINVETEEQAIEAVQDKFEDILNTTSTYKTLFENLDNKFDGSQEWTSNYIGNVGGATTDDAVVVNTLFAGQLQIVVNGVSRPASVIIKHENLDNNRNTGDDYVAVNTSNGGRFEGYGCEMTMYFTIDGLDTRYGTAPVYVNVYTCDRDANGNIAGDWYQIGGSYLGNAPIVGYNGESGGTGSFVTDNWTAVGKNYSPSDNYTYAVDAGSTLKDLVQVVEDEAIAEFQRLLDETKLMIDDLTYAGTGIVFLEEAYMRAERHYTLDENGKPIANQGVTRAQLCPLINDLNHSLTEAKKVIEELTPTE